MKKVRIIAHCLVANEERFVWYALSSVLPFVDKIMIWDTGSTDRTMTIIRSIKSKKIELVEKGTVDAEGHSQMRDQMLAQTDKEKYDWLLILDGDEIWPPEMFEEMIVEAGKTRAKAVVVRTINFVGDIFHKEPESAGHYRFADRVGHYNLRLVNLKLPKLHVGGPHGQQVYYSGDIPLQNLPLDSLLILDNIYYFHATHLRRSPDDQNTTKRSFKRKYEFGETVNQSSLPKIFFDHPKDIPDVAERYGVIYWLTAALQILPRKAKRFILSQKIGY